MFGKFSLCQNTVRKSVAAVVSGTLQVRRMSRQARTFRKSSCALDASEATNGVEAVPSLGLGQLRQKRPRGDDGWPTKGEAIDILEGQREGNLKRMRRLKGVLNGEEGFGERRFPRFAFDKHPWLVVFCD